ncbi:hypothetical protein [Chelativorans sp.]|uniref:hypothetical protein n=1 Tax=Chelativorans sp. TaxID=2203393 RepID=UPI002810C105|nr:hypothetical protein [Chelativorans sp.]
MRSYVDSASAAAIQSRTGIIPVNFIWIQAKNRQTGEIEAVGFWSGWDAVTAPVLNPDTMLPVVRPYQAGGSVIDVPAIPLESDLTIRTIRIRLSQINDAVENAIRGYDPRLAPVEIHRGFMDTNTHLLVAPALPRFIGWINGAPIRTPAVGGEGGIEIACVSHTRSLTKVNPMRRSDEQQRLRQDDRFRRYTGAAGAWLQNIHWGEAKSKDSSNPTFGPLPTWR